MKAKTFSKKLQLVKQTIINLEDATQAAIKGGRPNTSYNDPYNCFTECNTGICCINWEE